MLLNCGVGEDSLRVPWTARRSNQSILKEVSPEYSLEGLIWSWKSNTLSTWCEELTHLKRLRVWEKFKAGGEGDNRGWDCWMASLTQWTWVWANLGRCWWTGKPGAAVHGVEKSWTRLSDWTELNWICMCIIQYVYWRDTSSAMGNLFVAGPQWDSRDPKRGIRKAEVGWGHLEVRKQKWHI